MGVGRRIPAAVAAAVEDTLSVVVDTLRSPVDMLEYAVERSGLVVRASDC